MQDDTKVKPSQLDKQGCWDLLASPETTGTVVLILALVAMGEELFSTDIDALDISETLKQTYGVEINESLLNKLQAVIAALTTSAFYDDPEAFLMICSSLQGGAPGSEYLDIPTAPEMLCGILEIGLLQESPMEFSNPVKKVQAKIIESEAFDPDELSPEEQGEAHQEIVGFMGLVKKELQIAGFPESSMAAFQGKGL